MNDNSSCAFPELPKSCGNCSLCQIRELKKQIAEHKENIAKLEVKVEWYKDRSNKLLQEKDIAAMKLSKG
jgi:hypothetical protein